MQQGGLGALAPPTTLLRYGESAEQGVGISDILQLLPCHGV